MHGIGLMIRVRKLILFWLRRGEKKNIGEV